jgi:IrrE N-terminal-like domain
LPLSGCTSWQNDRWLIVLNGAEPLVRQRFSLIHEFKHAVDHRFRHELYFGRPGLCATTQAEYAADYFGACGSCRSRCGVGCRPPGSTRARSRLRRGCNEGLRAPAFSTIRCILTAAGLITPEPKKRPKSSYRRFQADQPKECWQSDFTHWQLPDGTGVEIINWLDDHFRCLLTTSAYRRITAKV